MNYPLLTIDEFFLIMLVAWAGLALIDWRAGTRGGDE